MSIRILSRCGIAIFVGAIAAGCSMMGTETPARGDECRWNRSACLYEGAYEPGERDYAEHEAARLNQAAVEKLRRGAR